MTEETAAPAAAEATTAPAVEAGTTAAVATEVAAAETPEEVVKPEGEATEETTEEDDRPKRLPRSQRDKRKISYLAGENARLAEEIASLKSSTPKADTEPTLEAFNYDVDKFNDAKSRWNVRQELASFKEEQTRELLADRQRRLEQGRVSELQERAEAIKDRIPDFDKAIRKYVDDGGEFSPHVKEAVLRVGPELAYYLAKNPDVADELNELEPIEAAIRIGELRPKLSLAQSRKQTQAPAPLKGLNGGAAPTKSLADLAKADDISAYVKARDAEDAAKRRR